MQRLRQPIGLLGLLNDEWLLPRRRASAGVLHSPIAPIAVGRAGEGVRLAGAAQIPVPAMAPSTSHAPANGGADRASAAYAPYEIRIADPLASAPEMAGRPIDPLIEAIANATDQVRDHLHGIIDQTAANQDENDFNPESAAWARALHENLDARADGRLSAEGVRMNLRSLPDTFAENERVDKRGLARRRAILNNWPATFRVDDNPDADGSHPLLEFRLPNQVDEYEHIIEEEATNAGVDPDLVKAVMYIENSRTFLEYHVARRLDIEDTLLPMNVHAAYWRGLGFSRQQLRDPRSNIRAAVQILSEIQARLKEHSVAKIGTLYNQLGAAKITDYGARLESIYRQGLWEDN